jgi:hypothetical protein
MAEISTSFTDASQPVPTVNGAALDVEMKDEPAQEVMEFISQYFS